MMSRLQIKLNPYQDQFIFSPFDFPAMISAWGTGKTLSAILRADIYSKYIPNNLGVIFRQEYVDLRDSTVKDYEDIVGKKVNSRREVEYGNGAKIMFRHIEEVNNLQNINLGWFFIEQVEELEKDDEFWFLWGRLRRDVKPDKEFKELGLATRTGFVIGNTGRDWVKELWKDKPQEGFHLIEAQTEENAHNLPDDFVERLEVLKKTKPEIHRRYVLNDWDVQEDDFVIVTQQEIDALAGRTIYERDVKRLIVCDPAAGGDECIAYVLENTEIIDSKIMHHRDTMKVVGELMILSNTHEISWFVIDTIGLGQGICDRLSELGKDVMPFCSSAKSSNKDQYYNIRAEAYWSTAEKIRNNEIEYFSDEKLQKQLRNVKYEVINSNGRIKIEPKQNVKERIGESPDRADAFVMGIWGLEFVPITEKKRDKYFREQDTYEFTPETC